MTEITEIIHILGFQVTNEEIRSTLTTSPPFRLFVEDNRDLFSIFAVSVLSI